MRRVILCLNLILALVCWSTWRGQQWLGLPLVLRALRHMLQPHTLLNAGSCAKGRVILRDTEDKDLNMELDIYAKSSQLLERLANSVYDRNPTYWYGFSVAEMHIVEDWLKGVIREILITREVPSAE
jgi:hypothetical protein